MTRPTIHRPLTRRPDATDTPHRRSPAIEFGGVAADGAGGHVDPARLFALDPTTTHDWFTTCRATALSPERKLQLAVFVAAWEDLSRSSPDDRVATAARRWFATDDPHWPLSFVRICDSFGLDAGAVRVAAAGQRAAIRLTLTDNLVAWAEGRKPWTAPMAALALCRGVEIVRGAIWSARRSGRVVVTAMPGSRARWYVAADGGERREVG